MGERRLLGGLCRGCFAAARGGGGWAAAAVGGGCLLRAPTLEEAALEEAALEDLLSACCNRVAINPGALDLDCVFS